MLFLLLAVLTLQTPPFPRWRQGDKYHFIGTKPHNAWGYFVFRVDDPTDPGWKIKIEDASVKPNYPGAYTLRTKVFHTKDPGYLYEAWVEHERAACARVGSVKPFETSPCKDAKYTGFKYVQLQDNTKWFAYEWSGCNFDNYLINYFPHEGIGANYTFYSWIYDPERILKICANGCDTQFIDMLEYEQLSPKDVLVEFSTPEVC